MNWSTVEAAVQSPADDEQWRGSLSRGNAMAKKL